MVEDLDLAAGDLVEDPEVGLAAGAEVEVLEVVAGQLGASRSVMIERISKMPP